MANNFLFHEVSEQEKEEIQKQAKGIMDSFASQISKIDKKLEEPLIERKEFEREDGKEEIAEMDRGIMLQNAPKKNNDFIVAERGEWK